MIADLEWSICSEDTAQIQEAVRKNKDFFKEINEVNKKLSLPIYKDSYEWIEFLLKSPYVALYDGGIIAPCAIISSINLKQAPQKQNDGVVIKKTYRVFYYHLLKTPSDKIVNRYLIALSNLLGETTEGVPIQEVEKVIRQEEEESPKPIKKRGRKKKVENGLMEQVIEVGDE